MNEEKEVEEQSKPLVLEKLEEHHADALLAQDETRGTVVIVVRKEQVYAVLEYLKTDSELAYTFLVDVTAVDNSQMESELCNLSYARLIGSMRSILQGSVASEVRVPVHETT